MMILYDAFLIGVKIAVAALSCALVLIIVYAVISVITSIWKKGDSDE